MADNEFANNVVVADDAFVVLGTAGPLKIGWSSANSRAELRDADGNVLAYVTDAGTAGTWVLNGNVTVGGNLTVKDTTAPNLRISGPTGTNRALYFSTSGVARWLVYANSGAESGTDGGSNFALSAHSDSGSFIDTPISVVRRANGAITLGRPVTTTGDVTVGGDLTVGGGDIFGPSGAVLNIRPGTDQTLALRDSGGNIRFTVNSSASASITVAARIEPDGVRDFGTTAKRWNSIYGNNASFAGNVSMTGLPTSDAGLGTGALWNDGGTVKIKT